MEQPRDPLNVIVPLQYLALTAVLVGGTLLARRRHGATCAHVVCGIDIALAQIAGRHVEVVNAGVVGCSSYQGLMRFREEAARYAPDVVLFSFGWNDAARAIDVPDEDFARSGFMGAIDRRTLFVRRVLLKYRLLLVARRGAPGARRAGRDAAGAAARPRVGREGVDA
jgi:hypothetical protein